MQEALEGGVIFVCCQHICAVVVGVHLAEVNDSICDEKIPHVEVSSVDVTLATILDWVFCHAEC